MKDYISILKDKFKFSNLELICFAVIIVVGSVILFRYDEESIGGRLFRFDKLTRTVEIRINMGDDEYQWEPRPHFKNLQHVRDYTAKQDRNRQIRAIEEQTDAMERMQRQQQINDNINTMNQNLNNSNDIMKQHNERQLQQNVEDIKNTLEAEKRERQFR